MRSPANLPDDRERAISPSNRFRFSEIDRLESRRIVLQREVGSLEKELTILNEKHAHKNDPWRLRVGRELVALAAEDAEILKRMSTLQPSTAREIGIMLTALAQHLHLLMNSISAGDAESWQQGESCQRILTGIQSAYATS